MLIIRTVVRVLIVFVIFVILFGIVSGNIGANRRIVLKTRKKYVNPSEEEMNEQIFARGNALREKVDREYTIKSRDGKTLHGYLIRPDGYNGKDADSSTAEPDRFIFCSHSYRSRLAGFEFGDVASVWLDKGYSLFLVDHRAHGESGGVMISFAQHESDDCIDWLNFMRQEFGEDIHIALHGQSMGAATVLMMSGKETLPENVTCIVSDSGYTDFYTELWNLLPLPRWLRGITLWPMDQYLKICHHIDMRASDALDAVKHAKVPILFIHGEQDKMVSLSMNEELYDACSGPKERVVFPDATHIKSHAYYPEEYERAVTSFAGKYL